LFKAVRVKIGFLKFQEIVFTVKIIQHFPGIYQNIVMSLAGQFGCFYRDYNEKPFSYFNPSGLLNRSCQETLSILAERKPFEWLPAFLT
jgi:hypothetical protein